MQPFEYLESRLLFVSVPVPVPVAGAAPAELRAVAPPPVVAVAGAGAPVAPAAAAPSLADFYAGSAKFVPDNQRTFDTNSHAHMHFIAFARDGLSSFARFGRYYMAYYIRGGSAVGLAMTTDGVHFLDRGTVLDVGPAGTFDSRFNTFPSVWKDGRRWYMVVEAAGGPGYPGDVALAVSNNGIHWTKAGVILRHQNTGWESANIGTPYLVKKDGIWYLFYHGFDGNDVRIGLATGPDLRSLTRSPGGQPVITTTASGPLSGTAGKRSIIEEGGTYYMTYEVSSDKGTSDFGRANWSTSIARSDDLFHWEPLGRPVLPTSCDTFGPASGFAFDGPEWFRTPDGNLHIYYRTQGNETRRATLMVPRPVRPVLFEAEAGYSGHQVGRADADGWSASPGDTPGHMVYGPYTTAVPEGARTATWRLMVGNVPPDGNRLLALDVYDSTTDRILAQRVLTRLDFARPLTYQEFSLDFIAPAGHRLEFRTYWHGPTYARQDRVAVT